MVRLRRSGLRWVGCIVLGIALAGSAQAADPACLDGADNDDDELTDFPADPGCHAANDDDETEPASSEPGEPRLVLALAASGSLNGDACSGAFTGGDSSAECTGDSVPCSACASWACANSFADDTRLHAIRLGLQGIAQRGDLELALVRSQQIGGTFTCPSASPFSAAGGWLGAASACAGGLDGGEVLVAFGPTSAGSVADWANGDDDWLDAGTPPAEHDFELRASGDRPLGGLLDAVGGYVTASRLDDPANGCRPYRVVLIADGGEGCEGDAETAADALLDSGTPVYVVGFAVSSSPVISELNALAAAGGTANGSFVDSPDELLAALDQIADDSLLVERCNGLDDDCDDLADEDFPTLGNACDNGQVGACYRTGAFVCSGDTTGVECDAETVEPTAETCNGIDDDCDGATDESGVCDAGSSIFADDFESGGTTAWHPVVT